MTLEINSEYLAEFSLENRLVCQNGRFTKVNGKLLTTKITQNQKKRYIFINKGINSAMNCEAYFSFKGVSSELSQFCSSLRTKKKNR